MSNQITAHIQFNFKGKTLTPTAILDLDSLMQQHGTIPDLHQMLATLNNIDSYSYEYKMMLGEEVKFRDAKGLATSFFDKMVLISPRLNKNGMSNNCLIRSRP